MIPHKSCPRECDIPAFLGGELSSEERAAFESHLHACAACQAEARKYEELIAELRRPLPDAKQSDLAPDILARAQAGGRHGTTLLRIAALFLCFVAAAAIVCLLRPEGGSKYDQRVSAAIEWLCTVQEPDGHWDAAKWGAQKNYTPGITALAVLALFKNEPDALGGPHSGAIRRGLEYLLSQQNEEGRIGAVHSGTPYNQGIGTLALLEACGRAKDPRWESAAARALAYIRSTQQPSGGWGYPRGPADAGNTSITVWQLQALLKASSMDQADVRPNIEKGMAWLSAVVDADGRVGYSRTSDFPYGHETLTAAGALCFLSDKSAAPSPHLPKVLRALRDAAHRQSDVDYYRLYFMTQALAAAGEANTDVAAKLREALVVCQADAGSFDARDRWSSAGGRVYATAMAVLAL